MTHYTSVGALQGRLHSARKAGRVPLISVRLRRNPELRDNQRYRAFDAPQKGFWETFLNFRANHALLGNCSELGAAVQMSGSRKLPDAGRLIGSKLLRALRQFNFPMADDPLKWAHPLQKNTQSALFRFVLSR
jgi:hypothetical protein